MGVSPVSVWEAGARNEMEEDVAVTRAVCNRAGNEPSRTIRFHNQGEGPYKSLLLVESPYYCFYEILCTLNRR